MSQAHRNLMNRILEGEIIEAASLDELIANNSTESLFLDYKNGLLIQNSRPEAVRIVRRWTSGFANAEGGVLVFGVSEPETGPRAIAACPPNVGAHSLQRWAETCLHNMTSYFSPPPRFQVVQHPQGNVLLIATARAPMLVPCIEEGEIAYYFRLNESTVKAPPYLVSDLVLGHRQHPALELRLAEIRARKEDTHSLELWLLFEIENMGLVDADDVSVGVIFFDYSYDRKAKPPIGTHLRSHLEIHEEGRPGLVHFRSQSGGGTQGVPCFGTTTLNRIGPVYLPLNTPWAATLPVYLRTRNAPVAWHELQVSRIADFSRINEKDARERFMVLEPTIARRPRVWCDTIPLPPGAILVA